MKNRLNKKDLAQIIASEHGLSIKEAERIITTFSATILDLCAQGKSVRIPELGIFEPKHTAPRVARNPRTGEAVEVPARVKLVLRRQQPLSE